ncbi:MAG: hypothetical protein IJ860_05280 [Eubacterium sp.]|nr:hypothetical protein [Eubacterium sp.]
MNTLISVREKLKAIYADYSVYIVPVIKFALAMALFLIINNRMGYLQPLSNLFVLVVLAAISAILPLNAMVLIGTGLIVLHCFGLGIETGAFALVLYLLLVMLYFRFASRDALVLLVGPLACTLNFPAAVPLCLGLMRGPESALSAICSVISWRFFQLVYQDIAPMKESAETGALEVLQKIPKSLFNSELVLYLIAFAATAIVVSLICRYLTTFSRLTAIIVGTVVYLVIMLAGGNALHAEISAGKVIPGTLLSALIAMVLNTFVYAVDYSKSKFIQFEDDDYFYYVKAIPKLKAAGARQEEFFDEDDVDPEPPVSIRPGSGNGEIDFETKLEDSLKDL